MKFALFFLALNTTVNLLAQQVTYSIRIPPGMREGRYLLPDSIDLNRYYTYREISVNGQPRLGWDTFYDGLDSLDYPKEAKVSKQQCKMTVAFRINEHGKLDSAYVQSIETYGRWKKCASCEALILDYMKRTPWASGSIHGIPVKTEDFLYIEFSIYDPNAKQPTNPFGG